MKKPRIIARLDIKGENVVKGIRFEGLRIMGNPNDLAKKYYSDAADEIIYIDTVASLYGRNNLLDVVKNASNSIFIPMTVGGGVRNVNDAEKLLDSGADKIAINTSLINNKELIKILAKNIGSQALVVSIHAKKRSENFWEVFIDNGRESTGIDLINWLKYVEGEGAGEIFLTSIDRDGTEMGMDHALLEKVKSVTKIPVIFSGGCKGYKEILDLVTKYDIDAIAIGSLLHYKKDTIRDIKINLKKNNILIANNL